MITSYCYTFFFYLGICGSNLPGLFPFYSLLGLPPETSRVRLPLIALSLSFWPTSGYVICVFARCEPKG